ncbi:MULTISPECIES: hypothetical protein [Flavobacteriaceae]|uniref:hypothetical protein n=1 Tax=Flavobacteriaceae TaxID=49546 RepID=UPI003A9023EB
MENIEIFEETVFGKNKQEYKFSILRYTPSDQYSKPILDKAVSIYVENKPYNEFVQIYNSNNWFRIIISGINEFDYIKDENKDERVEFELHDKAKHAVAKSAIIRGGLYSEKPLEYMSDLVKEYAKGQEHLHCVEIFMDNPWVRVVLFKINNLVFEPFKDQRL